MKCQSVGNSYKPVLRNASIVTLASKKRGDGLRVGVPEVFIELLGNPFVAVRDAADRGAGIKYSPLKARKLSATVIGKAMHKPPREARTNKEPKLRPTSTIDVVAFGNDFPEPTAVVESAEGGQT